MHLTRRPPPLFSRETLTVTARNLLVLMTDHQRADSIGMVQAGVEATPNLNHLASEGAFFARRMLLRIEK